MKKPKRPRDPNQLAKLIVDLATGEASEPPIQNVSPTTEARRKGGLKGGKARKRALSKTKRRAIAVLGAKARWRKKKPTV